MNEYDREVMKAMKVIKERIEESLKSKGIVPGTKEFDLNDITCEATRTGIVDETGGYFDGGKFNAGKYQPYWVSNSIGGELFSYHYSCNLPNGQYFEGDGDDEQFILQHLDEVKDALIGFGSIYINQNDEFGEIVHAVISTKIDELFNEAGINFSNGVFTNNDAYCALSAIGYEPENYGIEFEYDDDDEYDEEDEEDDEDEDTKPKERER